MMIMALSEFVKKKKKKKIFRPTYPNFLGHVTGNTHTFLFGLTHSEEHYIGIFQSFYGNIYVEILT